MSDFGTFEVLASAPDMEREAQREASDKLAAAVYDVREQFGGFLFQAKDIYEFRNRAALIKDDAMRVVNAHLMPVTSVMRHIGLTARNGILEKEFRQRLAAEFKTHSPTNIQVNAQDPDGRRWEGYFGSPEHAEEWGKSRDVGDPYNAVPENGHAARTRTAGDHAEVGRIPECDIHKYEHGESGVPAAYDGKTKYGPWANMCEDHFKSHGVGLGTGQGQRLTERQGGRHEDPWNEWGAEMNKGTQVAQPPELEDSGSAGPYDSENVQGRPIIKRVPGDASGDPRHQARRRRADSTGPDMNIQDTYQEHQGDELEPEGNFQGYLDSVDQGAPSKVDGDFVEAKVVRQYTAFCRRNRIPLTLGALEHHGKRLNPGEYLTIAAALQRRSSEEDPIPSDALPRLKGRPVPNSPDIPGETVDEPPYGWPKDNGDMEEYPPGSGQKWPKQGRRRRADQTDRDRQENHTYNESRDRGRQQHEKQDYADHRDYPADDELDALGITPELPRQGRRRQAAPDYLQKADEALTQLLTQKAEEFQTSIQSLQQALQVVQQAEVAQQAANPMGVQPPAGTVNVLPQQAGDPAAQGLAGAGGPPPGADPTLGAGAAAGGDPTGGAGQMAPPPAADPTQQVAARRRKRGGSPKGRAPVTQGV